MKALLTLIPSPELNFFILKTGKERLMQANLERAAWQAAVTDHFGEYLGALAEIFGTFLLSSGIHRV